jgi:hypothetical protein
MALNKRRKQVKPERKDTLSESTASAMIFYLI